MNLTTLVASWIGFIALACGGLAASHAAETTKPNIVYIVADDLGWKDVGFHGSDIKTPNIDRLAQDGARLEQFYVQPMCTPTRAALMTGRYPFRYGLQTAVIPSGHTYGLATDEWLLPQALKEAGYETAIIGKWHLGHADRKYWPQAARLRLPVRCADRRDRLLHARAARRARLVSQQQAGQGEGLLDHVDRQRRGSSSSAGTIPPHRSIST